MKIAGSPTLVPQRHRNSADHAAVLDGIDFNKFKPTKHFTQDNADILGRLASGSYSDPADQQAHLPAGTKFTFLDSKNNASLGIPAPDSGTQVTLIETKKALLVAARGTSPPWSGENSDDSEWKDFETDMVAVPVTNYDGSGKVHKGFKDGADGIWDQLKPHLETALKTHKAIHMSGHSLGGAIALLLADRMVFETGAIPDSVIRMGAPDTGWKEQAKHLEEVGIAGRTYNFKNCTDPVPGILKGSVEAGKEIYFNRHGLADISGGDHKLDKTLGAGGDVFHGHPDPTHRHACLGYNVLISSRDNTAVLKQVEN
ncbi:hypothetical protein ABS71_03190 [bacterium SCN 62-11]|nr:lipase family protein [Candidatus Eremiobacteraeota bacterium]ODT76719.1 MAG: hypothetical protein ABS71_03190 [bacterium SCN 62-11]